jgi:glycosyltransferase involved in cell wall biosynthesis
MSSELNREPRGTLLLNESLGGGGAERQLSQLADELSLGGDNVSLATWASPEIVDRYPLSTAVRRFHLRKSEPRGGRIARTLTTAMSWLRLVRLIRRLKPDAIVSFSDVSNILAVAAAKFVRRPVVVSIRTNPDAMYAIKPNWRRRAIAAYRDATIVVAQTSAVAQWCRLHGAENVRVIPNMVRGKMPEGRAMAERRLEVMSVGSLVHYKGHDTLLRAFAIAHRTSPEWRLTIVGEGPERGNLERLAQQLGVASHVVLPGFAEDVDELLAESSIFALPSRFEGFPNALVEAMAMGTAAIATDCDFGPRDIISDGEDGLLVAVDEVDALAAALDRLMGDLPLRERLADRAVQVRARFSVDAVVAQWRAVVNEAFQQAAGKAETP